VIPADVLIIPICIHIGLSRGGKGGEEGEAIKGSHDFGGGGERGEGGKGKTDAFVCAATRRPWGKKRRKGGGREKETMVPAAQEKERKKGKRPSLICVYFCSFTLSERTERGEEVAPAKTSSDCIRSRRRKRGGGKNQYWFHCQPRT